MIQLGSHECFSDLANQVGLLNKGPWLAPKGSKCHQEQGCEEFAHWAQLLGERPGSGDGEAWTSLTRQMLCEPLPASVLFVFDGLFRLSVMVGGCRRGDVGRGWGCAAE